MEIAKNNKLTETKYYETNRYLTNYLLAHNAG
jgi:hypothetical protein